MENWKKVPGYDGYEASDLGRIRSIDRFVKRGRDKKPRLHYGVILKSTSDLPSKRCKITCCRVILKRVGLKRSCKAVHKIVYESFVGPVPRGCEIDHVNRNPKDNRLENLRCVTSSQNKMNTGLRRDNKTGAKGISFVHGKWIARININKKGIRIGYFGTLDEAIAARLKAESELIHLPPPCALPKHE